MGHHIHAFLFRGSIDRAAAASLGDDVCLCELPQGVVALPLSLELLTDLEERTAASAPVPPGFLRLDGTTWAVGHAVARGGRFAYVETDYHAGIGDQTAAVWDGAVLLESAISINRALAALGVEEDGAVDRFEAICLDVMRDDDDFREGLDARSFAIYGRRLVGRYASAAGFLELRPAPHLARWDGETAHPWRLRPDRRYAEGELAYEVDHERSGTPRLRCDGVAWHYNDGPSLVHGQPPAAWSAWTGRYRIEGSDDLSLRLDKGNLYLDELRLLPLEDGRFETTTGRRVAIDGVAIRVDDRRGHRI